MNEEDFYPLIENLYEALFSEFVSCPVCSGHIGSGREWHDEYCVLYKALKENGHKFNFTKADE